MKIEHILFFLEESNHDIVLLVGFILLTLELNVGVLVSPLAQMDAGVDGACGYCLEPEERMINPKRLPCGHTFCLPCLKADLRTKGTITCPTCR